MNDRALMRPVNGQHGIKALTRAITVAQPIASKGDQILAVGAVSDGQILAEQLQVRQGDGEVIHFHLVIVVVFHRS